MGLHLRKNTTRQRALEKREKSVPACALPIDPRFRCLLDRRAWEGLPSAVCARFSKKILGEDAAIYTGKITEVRINTAGKALANFLRLVGAPLPLSHDTGVASVVTVTEDPATRGQIWTRVYANRRGFPQVIQSAKRFSGPTGLEEYIGYGITMALRASADESTITIESAGFPIMFGPWRFRLPGWLTPGNVTVKHQDLGNGHFEFSLRLVHPNFGELLYQAGRYQDQFP